MKIQDSPGIGVVIIGLNAGSHITRCIDSVRRARYPAEKLEIIYVDGGSVDDSVALARHFPGVWVIELEDLYPTPGRGRNAGFKAIGQPLVQFLDADVCLHPLWFESALPHLESGVAAVCGRRLEVEPNKNFYHLVAHIEWQEPEGVCDHFGGDVLVRRDVLVQTDGYDEDLVAGEESELSCRIGRCDWQIRRLGIDMTIHDIDMASFGPYWRRSVRTGHAYAEVGLRFALEGDGPWTRELLRVWAGALGPWLLVGAGLALGLAGWGYLGALLMAGRAFRKTARFKRQFGLTTGQALAYGTHLAFVVFPQFFGVLRYIWGRISGRPLRNRGRQKSDP